MVCYECHVKGVLALRFAAWKFSLSGLSFSPGRPRSGKSSADSPYCVGDKPLVPLGDAFPHILCFCSLFFILRTQRG